MNEEYTVFFGDVDIRDFGLLFLSGHDNPIIGGTRDKSVTLPGENGELDFGADLEPIPFDIPLYIPTRNPFELQAMVRKVKSLILDGNGKPKTFKLKFGYEPDKYYNVRFTGGISIERIFARSGKFALPLICHEGYAQSVAKNDEVMWGSEEITFTASYSFGHAGDGAITVKETSSTVVTLSGDNLRPIIKVSGTGTNVTLSWGGKTLSLGNFTNANWLIDLGEYVVLKDGTLALHLIKGDWLTMGLMQGDNLIAINGSGLNLTFSVEFRDRYY